MAAGRAPSNPDFLRLLSRRLEGTGDDALHEAREHGQRALESGASLVDLVGGLGEALLARLGMGERDEAAAVVRGGLDIAQELVVPFQMTVDGYRSAIAGPQEASRRLEGAKDVGEDRVRARSPELEGAKRGAATAGTAESDFLSRMSHELRTPLNAILGCAQLLDLDELTANQREAVSDILNAGQHLLMLINELNNGSRPGDQGPAEVGAP